MTESLDPATRPRVAWLGLGRMGTAMAGRLLDAGFPLAVWNRTPAKADGLVARGATRIDRIEDAVESDVIFSMVLDDSALDDLAAALADGAAGPAPRDGLDRRIHGVGRGGAAGRPRGASRRPRLRVGAGERQPGRRRVGPGDLRRLR